MKKSCKNNITSYKLNCKKLLYYNLTFYYHNEDIELLSYYLKNIDTIYKNIKSNNQYDIIIDISFFVSDLEIFITKLRNIIKFYTKIEKVYENKFNFIELKIIKIKFVDYDFSVCIKQNLSFPNKLIKFFNDNIKNSNNDCNNIDYGNNSIGFKRYCNNIICWNKYYYLKSYHKNKYIDIKLFSWQIDFGTFIGMPTILHPKINKMFYTSNDIEINLFEKTNNPLYDISNYWYCSKHFLKNNDNISNKYLLDNHIIESDKLENLYSEYDFYYFVITHIDTVVENFNIVNFTPLSIHNYKNNKLLYNNKKYVYSGFPNIKTKITQFKPKNKITGDSIYTNLTKGHYDKYYIVDISLTYLKYDSENKKIPITYNKNYTSFNEDIIYTTMLLKINNLFIPHPFLGISKCINKDNGKNNFTPKYTEIIYSILPYDDINNLKPFDI